MAEKDQTTRKELKIISGGQTGVDRAALDLALELGFSCGGYCPLGRLAEDGRIPDRYPLTETPTNQNSERTEWNVRDSDGTLILARGELTGGSALTLTLAQQYRKAYLVVNLAENPVPDIVINWLTQQLIVVLNLAGPRESESPGIYQQARKFFQKVLKDFQNR